MDGLDIAIDKCQQTTTENADTCIHITMDFNKPTDDVLGQDVLASGSLESVSPLLFFDAEER